MTEFKETPEKMKLDDWTEIEYIWCKGLMQYVDIRFCTERQNGKPCEHYRGQTETMDGKVILCAIPRPIGVAKMPIRKPKEQ